VSRGLGDVYKRQPMNGTDPVVRPVRLRVPTVSPPVLEALVK
jgi:hypothetical protein